ncbi:MAG: Hsp70 family protein, partial [Myxococcota bacterium]
AGAIAGLNVLSIINEPTAAAIAYGLDRIGDQQSLLVLDLGGGTFDVTVMEIRGTKLSTIASDGNAELGGKDWDDRLLNYVAEQFFEKYQLDPRDDASPYQELYERCLHAKISLSTKERAVVPVNYRGKRLAVKVTRELFEDITRDLVQQCEDTAQIVLEKAHRRWEDLDEVLLVGGSTRMPMIRDMLVRLSGKEPAKDVNPEECVALGASLAGVFRHRPNHPALQEKRREMVQRTKELKQRTTPRPEPRAEPSAPRGAVIGLAYGGHVAQEEARQGLPEIAIQDATTHSLGMIVLDRARRERVVELVPEGTPLPYETKKKFKYAFEGMTAVRVEVTEGTGQTRDEVTVIGKVELTGLPPRPVGTPIEVTLRYGVDQILRVQVADLDTGAAREVSLRFKGGLTAEQMAKAKGRTTKMQVG